MMSFESTDFPFSDDNPNDTPATSGDPAETQENPTGSTDDTPPQIVAETPVGGLPRPVIHPPAPGKPPTDLPGTSEGQNAAPPEPAQAADSPVEPEAGPSPSDVAPESDLPTIEGIEIAKVAETLDAAPETASAPEAEAAPETASAPEAEAAPETASAPEAEAAPEPPTLLSRPTEPKPLFAAAEKTEKVSKPEEWDDDLSPELAAVLFGGSGDASDEKPGDAPGDTIRREPPARAAAVQPARPAAPSLAAPTPVEPVHLTDPADARTLPLTAGGVSAAAPDARPEGKARYVRIEEPLRGDKGQRRSETWEYRGPDRPQVKGRELRTVKIEELSFADGSWKWRFERKYGDRGYDRRTVRANADRSTIERVDEINAPDELAGKRVKRRDEDLMILAAPVKEAHSRRGLLSRLLGRVTDHDESHGEKAWRAATPDEARHARKHGGDAF